jgi:hypothetical protein
MSRIDLRVAFREDPIPPLAKSIKGYNVKQKKPSIVLSCLTAASRHARNFSTFLAAMFVLIDMKCTSFKPLQFDIVFLTNTIFFEIQNVHVLKNVNLSPKRDIQKFKYV